MIDYRSDNTGRAAPEILEALAPPGVTNLTGPRHAAANLARAAG